MILDSVTKTGYINLKSYFPKLDIPFRHPSTEQYLLKRLEWTLGQCVAATTPWFRH